MPLGWASEIEGAGGDALAIECDVTRPEHVDACVERTLEAYGGRPVASGSESLDRWVTRDPERLAARGTRTWG